jgi:glycerophosphoryl diester phosphodiesterase
VRQALRKASPSAHIGTLANNAAEFPQALSDDNSDWVYVRYILSNEESAAVRRAGKKIFIAGPTVSGNAPERWQQAKDAGIDAILTDYPLELQAALRQGINRPANK